MDGGMVMDGHYHHHMRTPSRMLPDMNDMAEAGLLFAEKARSLGACLQPFAGWRSGPPPPGPPPPPPPPPTSHAAFHGATSEVNALMTGQSPSLPNLPLSALQQLYAINNHNNGATNSQRNAIGAPHFQLPLPGHLWSQWTLQGLGFGLNQLGLFGLGLSAALNPAASPQQPPVSSAAGPAVSLSPTSDSAGGSAVRVKTPAPRFTPYTLPSKSSGESHSPADKSPC